MDDGLIDSLIRADASTVFRLVFRFEDIKCLLARPLDAWREGQSQQVDQVHQLLDEGLSTYKITEKMGISRMSVHRILNQS